MNLNEAIKIMNNKYPKFKLISVVDYDNYFVFNVEPVGYDRAKHGEWLDGLIAIDKLFKVPMHFHPLIHNAKSFSEATKNIMYL